MKSIFIIMHWVLLIVSFLLSCTRPETEKGVEKLNYLLNKKKKDSSISKDEKKDTIHTNKEKKSKEVSDPNKIKDSKDSKDGPKDQDITSKVIENNVNLEETKNINELNLAKDDAKDKDITSKVIENNLNPQETKNINELNLETDDNVKAKKLLRNVKVTNSPKNPDKIRISWDQVAEKEIIKHYVVYKKSIDNAQFYSQLGIVLPNTCDQKTKKCWIDNAIKNESKKASTWFPLQRYLYRVASVGQDNKESAQSEPVEGYLLPKNHEEVLKDVWKTLVKSNENTKKITNSPNSHYIRHTERQGNLLGKFEKYRVIEQDNIVHNYHYNKFQEYNYIILNGYLRGVREYESIKILNVNGSLTITGMYQATVHFQNCEIDQDTGASKNGSIKVDYQGTSETFAYNDPMLDTLVIR